MNEVKQVLDGILALAEAEREKSESYKDLFAHDDIEPLLRDAEHRMSTIALDVCRVLEKKHGYKRVGNEAYALLLALPYLEGNLTKHIQATEGHACSVDKSFYLLAHRLRTLLEQANDEPGRAVTG